MKAKTEAKDEAIRLRCELRLSLNEIARRLQVSKSSVSLWVSGYPGPVHQERVCQKCGKPFPRKVVIGDRSLDLRKRKFCLDCAPMGGRHLPHPHTGISRIDWAAVQAYYDQTRSSRKTIAHFGMSSGTFHHAAQVGKITWDTGPRNIPLETIMIENSTFSTGQLKKRLFESGIKKRQCEECGVTEWNGKTLSFDLHHVNGRNNDHRLENLQILCPNCHSQTNTVNGKTKSAARKRKSKRNALVTAE